MGTIRFLTVFLSNGVSDRYQRSNQNATLDVLTDCSIPYVIVDGMDVRRWKLLDALFVISRVRGNYPQLFLSATAASRDDDDDEPILPPLVVTLTTTTMTTTTTVGKLNPNERYPTTPTTTTTPLLLLLLLLVNHEVEL
jgi:hypothetical protein